MNTHREFAEFLKLLVETKVEFVVVGGYAVAFYGHVRHTQDLDVFYRDSDENVERMLAALSAFGLSAEASDLQDPGSILRIGIPPMRIELINAISGLSFEEVWANQGNGVLGGVEVPVISLDDLLKNKRASGRLKDLADVDELGGNRG